MPLCNECLLGHSLHPVNAKTAIIFQTFSFSDIFFYKGNSTALLIPFFASCVLWSWTSAVVAYTLISHTWDGLLACVLILWQEVKEKPSVIKSVTHQRCHFTEYKHKINNASILRKCQWKCSLCRGSKQGWQLDFPFFCLGHFVCFWFPIRSRCRLSLAAFTRLEENNAAGHSAAVKGFLIACRVSVKQAWEASGLEWGAEDGVLCQLVPELD